MLIIHGIALGEGIDADRSRIKHAAVKQIVVHKHSVEILAVKSLSPIRIVFIGNVENSDDFNSDRGRRIENIGYLINCSGNKSRHFKRPLSGDNLVDTVAALTAFVHSSGSD